MIATVFLIAAVVTERNDVVPFAGEDVGCLPPPAYTFVGELPAYGLDSCWIPYGTAAASNEYIRATSNLVGVVASALGGAAERTMAAEATPLTCLLLPLAVPAARWSDQGEYLKSVTNTSLRIADQLNRPMLLFERDSTGNAYTYYQTEQTLEEWLLFDAPSFGSRDFEGMLSTSAPPVSSSWSYTIPYSAADTNLWKNIYPTYAACSNDIHFFPDRSTYPRVLPKGFGLGYWHTIWGSDVVAAWQDLYDALAEIPLACTLEDLLSAGTGLIYAPGALTNDFWTANGSEVWTLRYENHWAPPQTIGGFPYLTFDDQRTEWILQADSVSGYLCIGDENADSLYFSRIGDPWDMVRTRQYADGTDEYAHWANGTLRLDWKRLGIICQLERQMETTYKAYDAHLDLLPYEGVQSRHRVTFASYLDIDLPLISESTRLSIPMNDLSPSWDRVDDQYELIRDELGWTYPTCRVPKPTTDGAVAFSGDYLSGDMEIDAEDADGILTAVARGLGLTNGTYSLTVTGEWNAQGAFFVFTASEAEYWGWASRVTNTVTFVLDGDEFPVSDGSPMASREWLCYDQDMNATFSFAKLYGGWWLSLYRTVPDELDMEYGPLSLVDEVSPGSFYMPSPAPVFTAAGGGHYTNWTWTATGIADATGTNCTKTIRGDRATWIWSDGSEVFIYTGVGGETNTEVTAMIPDENAFLMRCVTGDVRVVAFPSFGVRWESTTNEVWVCATNFDLDVDYTLRIPYDVTNTTVRATLGLEKIFRGSSTVSDDNAAEVIQEFLHPTQEDWGRIFRQERPTVECMISATGERALADSRVPSGIGYGGDGFTWDGLNGYGAPRRKFRTNPYASPAHSKGAADSVRYNMLQDFDEECKAECVARGGWYIKDIGRLGRVTQADEGVAMGIVMDQNMEAEFATTVSNQFVVAGVVSVADDGGTNVVSILDVAAGYGATNALPAWIGSYGWQFAQLDVAVSNSYISARADGVQAPVLKTLWKFKNLRDPRLDSNL